MGLTTDPNDLRLGHGPNDEPVPQNEVYLVLSENERAKGFVRPLRTSYVHVGVGGTAENLKDGACGGLTTMDLALSETYAINPNFYGATYCAHCSKHRPVDEFVWAGTSLRVGS